MTAPSRTLLIVYEFARETVDDEGRGQSAFLEALREYDGHQLTTNARLIATTSSASVVLETLGRRLTPDDRLVVVEPARLGWRNVENGLALFDELLDSVEQPPAPEKG